MTQRSGPALINIAKCKATVVKAPSKITLSAKKVTLSVGETFEFTATLPKGTASHLTMSTTNTGIANISGPDVLPGPGKFTIIALKPGKETITVKTFNGKTAKFKLAIE